METVVRNTEGKQTATSPSPNKKGSPPPPAEANHFFTLVDAVKSYRERIWLIVRARKGT